MQLFIATLSTETNTFSPMPTGMTGFKDYFLRYGTATREPPNLMTEALHVWRQRAEERGWDVTESLCAIAEPAGRTVAAVYDHFRERVLSDLRAAGSPEIILLQLHGAMVAEQEDDCEGDLVECIRQTCPGAVIGVSLDLHCHVTLRLLDNCNLVTCFKEYPHDDASDIAETLFELAHRTHLGEINPVMATFDCKMIELYLTKRGRMKCFVDQLREAESRVNVLSVSLAHGFPWGDVADVGAKMLVITDGDKPLARRLAEDLGKTFFEIREEIRGDYVDLNRAMDRAQTAKAYPVVLADMGDNSGGGAPGDSTFMLNALLVRGLESVATGIYWDPISVQICQDAGIGSKLELRIGGKANVHSGMPVDLNCEVVDIRENMGQHLGKGLEPMGTVVRLKAANDMDILINDLRTQVYHPEAFEQMGIQLASKKIVTVKSLFHFYGPFEKIAAEIVQVATPGGTSPDFKHLSFTKRDDAFWPKVHDPFAQALDSAKTHMPRDGMDNLGKNPVL